MENGNDLQRPGVGPIYDEVRVNREEPHILVGQIVTPVPSAWDLCQEDDLLPNSRFNMIRHGDTALFLRYNARFGRDRGRLPAQERSARSFRLGLEFRQVSVQSVFRDSLAAIELLDAAFNLGVDLVPIFREPTILLLLRIQKAEQHLLHAGGTGRLELSLDAGLESRIADFDVHCSFLRTGRTFPFSS